jgi:hypothetical protein
VGIPTSERDSFTLSGRYSPEKSKYYTWRHQRRNDIHVTTHRMYLRYNTVLIVMLFLLLMVYVIPFPSLYMY